MTRGAAAVKQLLEPKKQRPSSGHRNSKSKKAAEPIPQPISTNPEDQLIEMIAGFAHDPLGFVIFAFPWGEGELEGFAGPLDWQANILRAIGEGLLTLEESVRVAVSSGHGIGKSALVSWIIYWAMSTCVDMKGVVTANTESQLRTKTWSELAKWHRLAINSHWFDMTATALVSNAEGHDKTWRVDQTPWSENRSEAIAGLHNKGKRVLLIFDEASAISDTIWEVAEGALTDEDTEILWCVFGNPTRARGRFRECWSRFAKRWKIRFQIDSRTVPITNKKEIQGWLEDYGEESDFFKVRVRGVFPSADVNALLTSEEVDTAMNRDYTEREITHAAKLLGVDVARQGGDDSVVAKRQGRVVFPLKAMHIPDSMLVAGQVARIMDEWGDVDATFIDATGGYGVGVVDKLREVGRPCIEVYFSGKAIDPRYFNKRSEMYFLMAQWIRSGGQLPRDPYLREELLAITYTYQGDSFRIAEKDDIKEEIGRSPDRADAVATTFAYPVHKKPSTYTPPNQLGPSVQQRITSARKDYNPLERL